MEHLTKFHRWLSLTCYLIQTIAFELIDLVPDVSEEATKQKDSIDSSLARTIDAWSGLSVGA